MLARASPDYVDCTKLGTTRNPARPQNWGHSEKFRGSHFLVCCGACRRASMPFPGIVAGVEVRRRMWRRTGGKPTHPSAFGPCPATAPCCCRILHGQEVALQATRHWRNSSCRERRSFRCSRQPRASPYRRAACGQIVPPWARGNPNGIVRLRVCIADRKFRCAATKRHVVAGTWRLPGMAASAALASRQPAGRCGVTSAVADLPSQCADGGL